MTKRLPIPTISALILLSASQLILIGAGAEPAHPTTMMGVSSAWTTATDKSLATSIKASSSKTASTKINTKINTKDNATPNLLQKPCQDLETILDSWQKSTKTFWAANAPKVTSFINLAMQRFGIGQATQIARNAKSSTGGECAPAPSLAAKPKEHGNLSLQSISSKHPTWLLRDGRLKTVAAQ